jgi:hypothetical protein
MPIKTTFVYDGRDKRNNNKWVIIEKDEGVPVFWWGGYEDWRDRDKLVMYPEGTYGSRSPDGKKREKFKLDIKDIQRAI